MNLFMEMNMSHKIMIVDDAAFIRTTIRNVLNNSGYQIVAEAVNGKEAVEKYFSYKPDIVTMDITMPEKDGLEALASIREKDPNAKIIMCSAIGQQAKVVEAIKLGAIDFIVKPFNPERILDALKKVTSN